MPYNARSRPYALRTSSQAKDPTWFKRIENILQAILELPATKTDVKIFSYLKLRDCCPKHETETEITCICANSL